MRKTIVLDANLLVLLVVGLTDPRYIGKHKRLRAYSIDDYKLLDGMIAEAAGIASTPHALTEASNLLRQTQDPAKSEITSVFKAFIQKTQEIYIESKNACSRVEFLRLGLSDSAILEMGMKNLVILSADAGLCFEAANAGYEVLNFNHYRNL